MPLIEVKNRFLRDESKQAELEVFLSAQDCLRSEAGIIDYGADINFIDVVRVHFSKEGKMKSIQCHEGSADRLEKQIDNAIYADHDKTMGRRVIFTSNKVSNYYRLGNDFQIIPAPPGSPEIRQMVGNYPAFLEFSYDRSPHYMVDKYRCRNRADELSNILSAFTFYNISCINNKSRDYLVFEIHNTSEISYEKFCEFSRCDDWKLKDEIGFSVACGTNEMPLIESTTYLDNFGLMPDRSFCFPAKIVEYFSKYNSLSSQDKEMARISAHWLHKSNVVYNTSASLSFSAIVFAFESLIRNPARIGECETCGQAIYEKTISKSFRELIETYARGIPRKSINDIYALRSKIAHGSGLMVHDQNVGFRFSDPLMTSEALQRLAGDIYRVVFINWLMSRD